MGQTLLRNYFLSAFRALKRDKLYAVINIFGLAVGLTAGLMILLFVRHELSYDKWVPDSERIFRLHTTYDMSGRNPFRSVRSAGPMAENLPLSFPEIESVVRLSYIAPNILHEGEAFDQPVAMVDPSFFDVFDLPMVAGSHETALKDFSSIVINETTQDRYFGERPALGKTLTLCCIGGETLDFKISAVLKDLPVNSILDLQAVILINKSAFQKDPSMFESWTSVNNYTFIKFPPGADIATVEARLPAFIDEKIDINSLSDKSSDRIHLSLMNLQDLHLRAGFQASDIGDIKPPGSLTSVIGFAATAILILAIASINYMNLSAARSSLRAREVSLRKVVGAEKKQLIVQFLGESIMVTFIAMVLAVILAVLTMPLFTNFLHLDINLDLFSDPILIFVLIGAIALVGVISGLYPAFHLSAYKPVRILTSNSNKSGTLRALGGLRVVLVVVQFSVTISLLIITGVIFFQTHYAKSVELGFERENRLVLRGLGGTSNVGLRDSFVNELRRLPEVSTAVLSSDVPTENDENTSGFNLSGKTYVLNIISTDYGFMEAYGINLLAGRDLSERYSNDTITLPVEEGVIQSTAALVNESAVRHLGFTNPSDVIGQTLRSENFIDGLVDYRIIGVIPDIQMRSIKHDILPQIYFRNDARLDNAIIAFSGNNVQDFVNKVKNMWHDSFPLRPFEYTFVDELITSQYAEEDRQSMALLFFTGLAILIAFMGLFGLASFVIVQRTKEIGIRKVLGAEVPDIVKMMLWQFSKPVLLASVIAWPVAWYLSQRWLQGFEQRISAFDISLYAGATLGTLIIAWITVAGHVLKATHSLPAQTLRYE